MLTIRLNGIKDPFKSSLKNIEWLRAHYLELDAPIQYLMHDTRAHCTWS